MYIPANTLCVYLQWEGEEVRQVLWLSVIFYISPETEVTSCLLLSNKAIYFLLEDSASSLSLSSGEMRLSNWSKPHMFDHMITGTFLKVRE